jgi:hypothetical protein
MRKAMVAMAAGAALMAWSQAGEAQTFGDQGTVTLSLERAFGFHWVGTDIERQRHSDLIVFGFGWYRSETAYHNPRAGVDGFIIDHLSLGGTVGIYGWGADGNRVGFLISPRVGYGAMLGKSVGIWPRGGFTFFSEDENHGRNYNQFAISGECMFAFFPQSSWSILVGPTMDLGLFGRAGNDDFHQHSVGLAVGMMGVL